MSEEELRKRYNTLYRFIVGERLMRLQVFKEGHPKRVYKLAECDAAMAALDGIKGFAKQYATPGIEQPALFEVEGTPQ
jgi:hypothetical protein